MKKLGLFLAVVTLMAMLCVPTLAFEKVDITGTNFSSTAVYYAKIQTFLDHGLGTNAANVVVAADAPALSVYGTSTAITGTMRSGVVNYVVGASGAAIVEALYVNITSAYSTGSWCNAVVGRIDYGTAGSASGGMAASFCAEMNLPGQVSPGGSYYPVHSYLNVPTNAELIDSTAFNYAFERYELAGGAKGEFDDYGDFFHIVGLTPAAGHVLSEGYTTLRCLVDTYDKYIVLSRIEDGLGMGASGSALTLAGASPLFQLYTTSAITTGAIQSAIIEQTMTVASTANQVEALKVRLTSDVKTGAWAQAIFAQMDYETDGLAHGAGSVICAELSLPGSSVVRGTYYVWQSEIDVPANCVMNANPIGVMSISVWGDNKTQFDDVGYFLDISGVTSGAADFFYDSTVGVVDGFLKCRINGATYYILLADDQS